MTILTEPKACRPSNTPLVILAGVVLHPRDIPVTAGNVTWFTDIPAFSTVAKAEIDSTNMISMAEQCKGW
jgi:hypothetical protein